jgi:mRNA interferase RelE/StbE
LNTEFNESFLRDLRAIKDRALLTRIKEVIQTVEQAGTLQDLSHLKKLRGERNYYRIRIGDYRVGLKIEGQLATFIRILNRKEIYRFFP